jgi:hypothetical protein
MITTILPYAGAGDSVFFYFPSSSSKGRVLPSILNSFVFDYITRQKMGGTNLNYFIFKQLPIIGPEYLDQDSLWSESSILDWITERNEHLHLSLGAEGWIDSNSEEGFHIRCELDAGYFHLYGMSRDDVEYVMESFPIVKKKDMAKFGEYRTKEKILYEFNRLAEQSLKGME